VSSRKGAVPVQPRPSCEGVGLEPRGRGCSCASPGRPGTGRRVGRRAGARSRGGGSPRGRPSAGVAAACAVDPASDLEVGYLTDNTKLVVFPSQVYHCSK